MRLSSFTSLSFVVLAGLLAACNSSGDSSSGSERDSGAAGSLATGGQSGNAAFGGASSTAGGSAGGGGGSNAMGGNATGGSALGGTGGTTAGNNAGGGNMGGSANAASCTPVNPNATQQAKNLLCYVYSQYKNHVISGQQETSWSNPAGDISWYTDNGMKAPAILGGDYLYPDGTSDRAIAYWKAGGIPMIRYHMGAPPLADTYENSKKTSNLDSVLQEGTPENISFKSKLDYAATELGKLQAANVAVLWAPFHEVQAGGWFWWAKGSGAQFVGLWKYMFDYLTKTKGLNNLVWLMPFSGSPSSAYYPGKEYLDLSGPDTYAEDQPFSSLFASAKGVIGDTVPMPLHETGRIPMPSAMFPSAAPWVLFSVWATYENDGTHNTLDNIKSVYADEHTVTRDEVPDLNGVTAFDFAPAPDAASPAAAAAARPVTKTVITDSVLLGAAKRAWTSVKSLDDSGHFHEAQVEARAMLQRYPGTSWAEDVERHTLVYPLDQPSREAQQAAASAAP